MTSFGENVQKPQFLILKGIGGDTGPKFYISFILIYVIALSFFFPKWGHTLHKYRYFWFYDHLGEGGIVKYREKSTL